MAKTKTTGTSDESSRDFIRPGTFATLAGSTTAVVLLTNTATAVLGDMNAWVPLALAIACSLGAYVYAMQGKSASLARTPRLLRYALVALNGCLIYTTAFGVQGVVASETAVEEVSISKGSPTTSKFTLSSWRSVLSTESAREIRTIKMKADAAHK